MLGTKNGASGRGSVAGRENEAGLASLVWPGFRADPIGPVDARARDHATSEAFSSSLHIAASLARIATGADRAAATLTVSPIGRRSLIVEHDGPAPPLPLSVVRSASKLVRARSGPVTRAGEHAKHPSAIGMLAAVPLRLDAFTGCLIVSSASRCSFSEPEMAALSAAARSAELTLGGLRAAASAERRRIACLLHDTFAQTLTGLLFAVDELDDALSTDARSVRTCALQAMRQMRSLIDSELKETGSGGSESASQIADMLRILARAGVAVELRCAPGVDRLGEEVRTCIHHVAQEALLNVRRHAEARRVRVRLVRRDRHVELIVADDGRGLERPRHGRQTGAGIRMMRERVEDLGGTFIVQSVPGEGTRVQVRIPRAGRTSLSGTGRHRG